MRPHVTDTVVMVPPEDFAFNEQTARDNDFQKPASLEQSVRTAALAEFEAMVTCLRAKGITVLLLPKTSATPLPDAVFPNNWFTTWPDGNIQLYPMRTRNRQAEVQPVALRSMLRAAGFAVRRTSTLEAAAGQALEGTGALVFDHRAQRVYAALSERCSRPLLFAHAAELGYEAMGFQTRASTGRPIYHTNVVLSIGEDFAILCPEAVPDSEERAALLRALRSAKRDVIELSLSQMDRCSKAQRN